jgi:hypothetical protein
MKLFLNKMLSANDAVSMKRVIGLAGFTILVITMFITAVAKRELTPDPILVDAVTYITIAALFGNTVEKFASKNQISKDENV